jgi:lysophospholipase L1-like esterase
MKRNVSTTKAWIYAGLIVASGVGVARIITHPLIRRGGKLLLVGDSMTVGLNAPLRALASDAGVAFGWVGEQGTRIDQWASNSTTQGNLLNKALAEKPSLVLVCLGTNDEALKKYGTADVLAKQRPAIDALEQKIRASGADLVWICPPTNAFMDRPLRDYLKSLVGSRRWFPSDKYAIPRQPDALHPTVKGYAGWAGLIWQHIT